MSKKLNYFFKILNKIRPWELILISFVTAVLFAFVNLGLVIGCEVSTKGNLPCDLISHSLNTFHQDYYFSLSWVQLVLMLVLTLLFVKKVLSKRKDTEWTNFKLNIYVVLSLTLFTMSFNFVNKSLNSIRYQYRTTDELKYFKNWTVDCNNVVVKTPLFTYDPNEGQTEKTKDFFICSKDRFSRDHVYDIFGHEK